VAEAKRRVGDSCARSGGDYACARGEVRSDKMLKRDGEQWPREVLRMLHFANSVLARHKAGPDADSRKNKKRPRNDMADILPSQLVTLLVFGVLCATF
jgi:hypothetical protein